MITPSRNRRVLDLEQGKSKWTESQTGEDSQTGVESQTVEEVRQWWKVELCLLHADLKLSSLLVRCGLKMSLLRNLSRA